MKKRMAAFLAVLVMVLGGGGKARAGGKETGGGTGAGADFAATLRSVIDAFKYNTQLRERFPEFSVEDLEEAFKSRIVPQDHVYVTTEARVRGKTQTLTFETAVSNNPDSKLIEVSKTLWPRERKNACRKRILALHEALGILRLETNSYPISSRLCDPYATRLEFPALAPLDYGDRIASVSRNQFFTRMDTRLWKTLRTREQIEADVVECNSHSNVTCFLVEAENEWILVTLFNELH